MTRTAGFGAVVAFILIVLFVAWGFSGNAAALTLGIVCTVPLFMLFLGLFIGRASNEFSITRKERTAVVTNTHHKAGRSPLPRVYEKREPLG